MAFRWWKGGFPKFPYTNFHEANLDYFLSIFSEIWQEWEELYSGLTEWKDTTEEEFNTWKTNLEEAIAQWETAFTEQNETWKSSTQDDLEHWEDIVTDSLNAWKAEATATFNAIRVQAAASATEAATSAESAIAAKISAEAAETAAETAAASVSESAAQIATNASDIAGLRTAVAFDNLLWIFNKNSLPSYTHNGITYTYIGNDTFTIDGETTGNISFYSFLSSTSDLDNLIERGKTYYLEYKTNNNNIVFQAAFLINGNWEYNGYIDNAIITIPENCEDVLFRLRIARNLTINNATIKIKLSENPFNEMYENDDNTAVVIYTDFEKNNGFWLNDGTLDNVNNHKHTQLLPVKPGTIYYFSTSESVLENYDCFGMFYDAIENPISILANTDITPYVYDVPNKGDANSFTYVKLYKFTTPNNANYISMNISTYAELNYRNYLSNIPVFAGEIYGDLIIKNTDPVYQKNKNRKLCIIGTSQIMIDRLSRTGKFDGPDSENSTEYIIGLQEYLMPWWKTVDSYGYSNAAMMYKEDETTKSLYTRVVTDQLDIANYDDYFITHSSADLTNESDIGTLNNMSDLGDNTTYIGALRQIIDYIYSLNPNANIFVQTRLTRYVLGNSERLEVVKATNQKIRELADMLSITCVDTAFDSGFNYYNAPYWCYDTNGHHNQIGNHYIGLSIRKEMIGF